MDPGVVVLADAAGEGVVAAADGEDLQVTG